MQVNFPRQKGMEVLLYMRQLMTTDDYQLPETWATLNKKGGARFARHMADRLLDHPVTEIMVPGLWPALVTCLALDVYRGAWIGLLTGPQVRPRQTRSSRSLACLRSLRPPGSWPPRKGTTLLPYWNLP